MPANETSLILNDDTTTERSCIHIYVFFLLFFLRHDDKSNRATGKKCAKWSRKSENFSRHLRQNISSSRALTFPCFLIIEMSLPSALSRATPAKGHHEGISINRYDVSLLLFICREALFLSLLFRTVASQIEMKNCFFKYLVFF